VTAGNPEDVLVVSRGPIGIVDRVHRACSSRNETVTAARSGELQMV